MFQALLIILIVPLIHASIFLLPSSSLTSINATANYTAYGLFESATPAAPSFFGQVVLEHLNTDCSINTDAPAFKQLPPGVSSTLVLLSTKESFEQGCHEIEHMVAQLRSKGYPSPVIAFYGVKANLYDTAGPMATHDSYVQSEFCTLSVAPSFASDAMDKLAAGKDPVLARVVYEQGPWNEEANTTVFKFLHWFFIILYSLVALYGLGQLIFGLYVRYIIQQRQRPGHRFLPDTGSFMRLGSIFCLMTWVAIWPYRRYTRGLESVYYLSQLVANLIFLMMVLRWCRIASEIRLRRKYDLLKYFVFANIAFSVAILGGRFIISNITHASRVDDIFEIVHIFVLRPLQVALACVFVYFAFQFLKEMKHVYGTSFSGLRKITNLAFVCLIYVFVNFVLGILSVTSSVNENFASYIVILTLHSLNWFLFHAGVFATLTVPLSAAADDADAETLDDSPKDWRKRLRAFRLSVSRPNNKATSAQTTDSSDGRNIYPNGHGTGSDVSITDSTMVLAAKYNKHIALKRSTIHHPVDQLSSGSKQPQRLSQEFAAFSSRASFNSMRSPGKKPELLTPNRYSYVSSSVAQQQQQQQQPNMPLNSSMAAASGDPENFQESVSKWRATWSSRLLESSALRRMESIINKEPPPPPPPEQTSVSKQSSRDKLPRQSSASSFKRQDKSLEPPSKADKVNVASSWWYQKRVDADPSNGLQRAQSMGIMPSSAKVVLADKGVLDDGEFGQASREPQDLVFRNSGSYHSSSGAFDEQFLGTLPARPSTADDEMYGQRDSGDFGRRQYPKTWTQYGSPVDPGMMSPGWEEEHAEVLELRAMDEYHRTTVSRRSLDIP